MILPTFSSSPRTRTPISLLEQVRIAFTSFSWSHQSTCRLGTRVDKQLVDSTGRVGYALTGWKPTTPQARASEYYQFDWEYAQTPEQSSWIASSWVYSQQSSRKNHN